MAEVIRGQIGDHPDAMSDTATAAAILEHLDSLALIRWPWDASCRDLHQTATHRRADVHAAQGT